MYSNFHELCKHFISEVFSGQEMLNLLSLNPGRGRHSGFRIIKERKGFPQYYQWKFWYLRNRKRILYQISAVSEKIKKLFYTIWEPSDLVYKIEEIKSISVKNQILYVEVPAGEPSGGMEIQVISSPWFYIYCSHRLQIYLCRIKIFKIIMDKSIFR